MQKIIPALILLLMCNTTFATTPKKISIPVSNQTDYPLIVADRITDTSQIIQPHSNDSIVIKNTDFMKLLHLTDKDGGVNKGFCYVMADFDKKPIAVTANTGVIGRIQCTSDGRNVRVINGDF